MIFATLLSTVRAQKVDGLTLWLIAAFGAALILDAIIAKDMSRLARLAAGLFGAICVCIALIGLIAVPHT